MITIISPAKSQNYKKNWDETYSSQPTFRNEVKELIDLLRNYSVNELEKLMSISENLAEQNFLRFKHFSEEFNLENSKPAIFAYNGDVYEKLNANNLDKDSLEFAKNHLRIITGLYGVLAPSDLIQPYRLEMSIKLKSRKGKNLYEFWQDKITNHLNELITKTNSKYLINLASIEYSKVINNKKLNGTIININFKENKNSQYKTIALLAKQARGLMTKFILENKINNPQDLKEFNLENYIFNKELSNESNLVFTRG